MKEKIRHQPEQPGQPHHPGRPGDRVDLRRHGHHRQLRADHGDDVRHPQPPEVGLLERAGVGKQRPEPIAEAHTEVLISRGDITPLTVLPTNFRTRAAQVRDLLRGIHLSRGIGNLACLHEATQANRSHHGRRSAALGLLVVIRLRINHTVPPPQHGHHHCGPCHCRQACPNRSTLLRTVYGDQIPVIDPPCSPAHQAAAYKFTMPGRFGSYDAGTPYRHIEATCRACR